MKKLVVLLLAAALLLAGCTRESSKAPTEISTQMQPEASTEIMPEEAISVPYASLRVVYATDTGFVGVMDEGPGSHLGEGKKLNVVIEEGVEACYWEDRTVGCYIDAMEVPYEPGMLVIIQYTNNKWIGDTVYPELLDIPYETNIQPMED